VEPQGRVQIPGWAQCTGFKSHYLDELNRLGLTQERKRKIIRVLNRATEMGFTRGQEGVDGFFNWLQQQDYSYETKWSYWCIYRKYMRWLNPNLNWNYKLTATAKTRLPEVLTLEEVVRMVKSTKNPRNRAMICLMFDSGMRPGEIVNLKIEDIIFDMDGLIVNVPVEGKKGQRRIRTVNTMNSEQALKEYLRYHEFKSNPYSLLFYNIDKKNKLSVERLNEVIKETVRRAKIEKKVTSYTLRHTSATYLAKHLTEQEMKIYFGWTMGSDMVKTYVHLSCRDLDEKVLELNKKPTQKEEKEDLRQLIREELLRVLREV